MQSSFYRFNRILLVIVGQKGILQEEVMVIGREGRGTQWLYPLVTPLLIEKTSCFLFFLFCFYNQPLILVIEQSTTKVSYFFLSNHLNMSSTIVDWKKNVSVSLRFRMEFIFSSVAEVVPHLHSRKKLNKYFWNHPWLMAELGRFLGLI